MKPNIDFEDTSVVFADKSDLELMRTRWLFATMNQPTISAIGVFMTRLLMAIRFPVKWVIKHTIFAQFCGGESLKECEKTIIKLAESNIRTILDYSVEGGGTERDFDRSKKQILATLDFARDNSNIPIAVLKLTGICSFGLLAKKQAGRKFDEEQETRFRAFEDRLEEICKKVVACDKKLFIDAEESWIQGTIDEKVNELMAEYNKERVYVYNTFQMYRRDALDRLKAIHQLAVANGFKIGAKLVRGAYMEKERDRAEEMGYPDPIQPDKLATDQDFDEAVRYCINHLDNIAICAGTHNETSSLWVTELMTKHDIATHDERVYLAQLYGMSDNISYSLANAGYNVAKYVPYGPLRKVVPYMMRRAEENTAIAGQTSREYRLVMKEIQRRKTQRN